MIAERLDPGMIEEGRIAVTGGKVWYKITGLDKMGVPILVLHGGPGAPHDYLEPLQRLADRRPVIFYDQLGCGNSDRPDDRSLWTIERFVDELALIRKALGLKRVHILGQSWGTMLAVDYMLRKRPKGVVSLVLSGPCLSTSRFASDQRTYLLDLPGDLQRAIYENESMGSFGSTEYQDAMMFYYRRHVCRLDPWPDCLNRTMERLGHPVYEYMWGRSEFTFTGTLQGYERADELREIAVPTLFTCGRYDEATPSATMYYNRKLPGSKMVVFEDASHEHHLEKTLEYLQVVGDFIDAAEKINNKI